nr:hypothetical protein Iba_chr11eCG15270 [Ipomoea batatas]GME11481.1 hypothetical protein Iba_scaffold11678CG0010 [Ipomoea batatas]
MPIPVPSPTHTLSCCFNSCKNWSTAWKAFDLTYLSGSMVSTTIFGKIRVAISVTS